MSEQDKPVACKHPQIITYAIADEGPGHGQPAGLWGCAACNRKFAPIDPAPPVTESVAWQIPAAEWLRMKSREQESINVAYPDHVRCYPSWTHRVFDREWLAAELDAAASDAPPNSYNPGADLARSMIADGKCASPFTAPSVAEPALPEPIAQITKDTSGRLWVWGVNDSPYLDTAVSCDYVYTADQLRAALAADRAARPVLTDEQIEGMKVMLTHYHDDPRVQCLRSLVGWTVPGTIERALAEANGMTLETKP